MAGRHSEALEWTTEDNLTRIKGWARDGLTDKDIAEKKIGISERTFCRWKSDNPSIVASLKEGRAPVDTEVEGAMVKSALGHKTTVRKPMKLKTTRRKDGMEITEEHIEYVDEEIYIPPQVVAQIFWLKNRKKDYWKDKPESENNEAIERIVAKMAEILNGVDSVIE